MAESFESAPGSLTHPALGATDLEDVIAEHRVEEVAIAFSWVPMT